MSDLQGISTTGFEGTTLVLVVESNADLIHADREGEDDSLGREQNVPVAREIRAEALDVAERRRSLEKGVGDFVLTVMDDLKLAELL